VENGTYVNRSITTNESKYTTHDTNAERQTLRVPPAHIDKRREDLVRIAFGPQDQQGDEDGEEAEDMQDQERAFELWKEPAGRDVDEDTDQDDGPV
jgi:hypothetical protein